jgi:DNA-binding response OmpR family regulator
MKKSAPKILIIDDDPTVLKLIQSVLTSNGYEAITAGEAPNGLELAMKQKHDLVILDVMMPIINGFNICRMLKNEHDRKHIPIIMLTSRSSDSDQKIGQEVGADAYVAKPFKTEELLGKIKELLKIT